MKKQTFLILCLVMVMVLSVGCRRELSTLDDNLERIEDQLEYYIEGEGGRQSVGTADTVITKESAEEIALNHAGFTREQVSRLHTEYEIDDGIPEFSVEFYVDGWEYDYDIHGETGQILSYDKDFD